MTVPASKKKTVPAIEEMKTVFSKRFKALRKSLGMTQTAFASKIGISRPTINLYESGDRIPDISNLEKICSNTGCSPRYLIGLSDTMQDENSVAAHETGLSEAAIEKLKNEVHLPFTVSRLIECPSFTALGNLMVQNLTLHGYASRIKGHDELLEIRSFKASEAFRKIFLEMLENEENDDYYANLSDEDKVFYGAASEAELQEHQQRQAAASIALERLRKTTTDAKTRERT